MVRYLVLGLLRNGEKLHGYALVRAYRDLTGLQLNSGNFYRELQRLGAESLVRQAAKLPETDPRRMQYEITDTGAADFDAWFAGLSDCAATNCEDELSLRTLFIARIEPALARRLLQRWRDGLWLRSQMLEREREIELMRCGNGSRRPFPARASLLGRRLRYVVADLDFLDEFRRTYDTWLTETRPSSDAASAASPKPARRAGPATRRR
jgi:DNA-binding PadR family transcriptional regulator